MEEKVLGTLSFEFYEDTHTMNGVNCGVSDLLNVLDSVTNKLIEFNTPIEIIMEVIVNRVANGVDGTNDD